MESKNDVILEKLEDAAIPGAVITFDPEEAEVAGCFVEDAIDEKDAAESIYDEEG